MTLPPTSPARTTRTFTIYLIRHGEAAHNVEEKRAEKRLLAEAAAEGLGPDHPETRERIMLARQAILMDESFFDAALTSRGEEEAKQAYERIAAWTSSSSSKAAADNDPPLELLPAPQEVFVSPLRRALRTADLIFPPRVHAQQEQQSTTPIHVYEDLRERLTGRPADNRFASDILANRFKRFDFHHLRVNSFHHFIAPNNNNNNNSTPKVESGEPMRRASFHPFNDSDDEEEEQWLEGILDSERGRPRTKGHVRSATATVETSPLPTADLMQKKWSSCNTDTVLEDNEKLQERAIKLFDLLAKYQSDSVAIVTHKAFLRELEHGCFGLTDTKEFQNCEVRVYRATFQMCQTAETILHLEKIERLK